MPRLLEPLPLRAVTLPNRIVVSPMCQYSAVDGVIGEWHVAHYSSLALSGAGLVVIEATHVEAIGRITHGCLGLWNDAQEEALRRLVGLMRRLNPDARIAIQLAHAGRKASSRRPWEGGDGLGADERPWPTVGPSAIAFDATRTTPAALDAAGLAGVVEAFEQAARRAARAGVDIVEFHGAHGYLLHQFLSPLANRREDAFGGSFENRSRLAREIAVAIRAALPADMPLGVRITGSDWMDGGIDIDEAAALAAMLKPLGCDFFCVSSGGIVGGPGTPRIPVAPGYQAPFAAAVKAKAGVPTRAVGMIAEPGLAEEIVASGRADMVALARAFLDDPRWGWRAADALGQPFQRPRPYERSGPKLWAGHALAHPPRG